MPEGHKLLLPREKGTAQDRHSVTRMINRAGAAAGLGHIHPHQLRHTLATELLRAGAPLADVGQVLRHRSQLSTAIYAKVDVPSLRAIAQPWPSAEVTQC